jgi:hypothetical protein
VAKKGESLDPGAWNSGETIPPIKLKESGKAVQTQL